MKIKSAIIYVALAVVSCSCWFFGAANPGEQKTPVPAAAKPAQVPPTTDRPKGIERPIFISIPKVFTKLERPPVKFNHDKHTTALEKEGCETCHPKDPKGAFLFTFPKARDERNAKSLMNSFHDECIGCHQKRSAEKKKAGPRGCGECHRDDGSSVRKQYVPILPEYYDVVKDAYHKDCLSCHRERQQLKEAGALDWKSFYVKEQKLAADSYPKMVSDYLVHYDHDKALEKKCDPCHYLSPARRQSLAAAGKQPSNRDWLLDLDETNSLTDEKAAHARCLNCHLKRKAEDKKGGPYVCNGCHTGIERPSKDMNIVPRPAADQKERYLIELKEDARAKSVPFNHKSHEANSRSCQECHHKTVRPCGECHTPKASKQGGGIALAEAYHKVSSSWSCIGCHETVKKKPACAGCHSRMSTGFASSACGSCHTGELKSLDAVVKLPSPKELLPNDTKEELVVSVMEQSYKPSKMPHSAIATKLTEFSNQSTLATYFHREETTICAGCHHRAQVQKKIKVPQCGTCHINRQQPEGAMPTLLGAYHQQCLGCHKQIVQTTKKLPQNCTGCHEEKPKA